MKALARFYYELSESIRIALAQIRANKMRSALTALGVIIGIVAVTLMGAAISGIDIGFQNSLAMLGDDVLYVQKWPWGPVEDWWNFANRPQIQIADAERLNRIIENTPNSLLDVAVPVAGRGGPVKAGDSRVDGIYIYGTTADYARITGRTTVRGGCSTRSRPAAAGRCAWWALMSPKPCSPAGRRWGRPSLRTAIRAP